MSSSAESDAKRALNRLRRALEKAENEIDDEQEQRLADKILHTGGLEPGRVRRSL